MTLSLALVALVFAAVVAVVAALVLRDSVRAPRTALLLHAGLSAIMLLIIARSEHPTTADEWGGFALAALILGLPVYLGLWYAKRHP